MSFLLDKWVREWGSHPFGNPLGSMGRAMSDDLWFEEPGEELDDDAFADDQDDDDRTPTVPCPDCGAEIYEDTPRCPICGRYVTHQAGVWSGRPGWWILLGLLGILAAILTLAGLAPW
jgi:hypothetical protein